MTFNSRTEFAIFFYILHHVELISKCQKDFFSDDTTKGLYEISAPFVAKYKECPSAEEVKQLIAASDWTPAQKDKINDEIVDLLWRDSETYKTIYDQTWIKNQVEAFLTCQTINAGLRETISYVKLNSENITIDNYKEMSEKIQNMFDKKTTVEFNSDYKMTGTLVNNKENRHSKDAQHFTSGIKFIDEVTGGGYQDKKLWMIVGAPKSGKSRWLYNLAAKAYNLNYNTAYVTLELSQVEIANYTSSVIYSIPTARFNESDETFTSDDYDKITTEYNKLHNLDPIAYISEYPYETLTVSQLEKNLLNEEKYFSEKLGKEFHYKVVFIDYLNNLANEMNNNSENTYMKIKQITEKLRSIAQQNGWCIVSATQSKQAYWNSDTIDMSSCSESAALQATCDQLFGIISNPQMTQSHYQYLKILLSRTCGIHDMKQKFNINEKYMRLEQSSESMIYDDGSGMLDKKDNQSKFRKQKYIKKDNIKEEHPDLEKGAELFTELPDDIRY